MTYQEKATKFENNDARWCHRNKTPLEELPLEFKHAGSIHNSQVTTCDLVLWVRFYNDKWFIPYGNFQKHQIIAMIELCSNDNQVGSLMELLSATKD